ncbi:MAG: NAD+ synthase, partial [Actinomycetota bacterium]
IPSATLTKAPSAELRPDQRDDQSLPPYDVLDAVLALYEDHGISGAALAGIACAILSAVAIAGFSRGKRW